MKVFKFGGASVKDADSVRNLSEIVKQFADDNTLIVVSAMGKMTNAFETIIHNALYNTSELEASLKLVKTYHNAIVSELFSDESHPVFQEIESLYNALSSILNTIETDDYNFVYDQIIGYGELLSTTIVSHYLNEIGLVNRWIDVRDYIKTDNNYRRATVDWEYTERLILPLKQIQSLGVIQGFLGSYENSTTTLGREGSDYTAAILAYALQAESVTIWKDVPGVLNADPRYFKDAQLLEQLTYTETIELAFYGASVIHPKTLQPLQQKQIPLYVKSFLSPKAKGTTITSKTINTPYIPCYILKKNQVLIQLTSLDFSYIVEEHISDIFNVLHQFKMKVGLIQNSAISFTICVEDVFNTLETVKIQLKKIYKVHVISNVTLYTVRHYNDEAITLIEKNKEILLKQRTQNTVQIVTK